MRRPRPAPDHSHPPWLQPFQSRGSSSVGFYLRHQLQARPDVLIKLLVAQGCGGTVGTCKSAEREARC
eukprot:342340-Prymnesium_polylepis.1